MQVILLTQAGCTPCLRVKRILGDISRSVPEISVREVAYDSDEGTQLAETHSILFPPAVVADGRLVGKGKIREEELRRAIGAPPLGGR